MLIKKIQGIGEVEETTACPVPSTINGRVMIQYERSGVPSRISRWPTAISLPLTVLSFSANYAASGNFAILSNLTGLSAKLQLLDDSLVVDSH